MGRLPAPTTAHCLRRVAACSASRRPERRSTRRARAATSPPRTSTGTAYTTAATSAASAEGPPSAEGKRQEAKGKRQKWKNSSSREARPDFCPLPFAFCLLPSPPRSGERRGSPDILTRKGGWSAFRERVNPAARTDVLCSGPRGRLKVFRRERL